MTLWYVVILLGTFFADRLTKWHALNLAQPIEYCDNISFELTFNKGVTWGIFSSDSVIGQITLSLVIAIITLVLGFVAYSRLKEHVSIIGETLVLSGAISNLIDRLVYGGVVDFIHIHHQAWSFPIFNLADVFIVVGVSIMFVFYARE